MDETRIRVMPDIDDAGRCTGCGVTPDQQTGDCDCLDRALRGTRPAQETAVTVTPPRTVRLGPPDPVASRRGKNNRKRGNAAELDVARAVGGRKVGPMGWPWDVEMPGYARLQVRKLATPPSINDIRKALDAIAITPSDAMPGYVWIEPGRGGDRLIVFRLRDWQERHGPIDEAAA